MVANVDIDTRPARARGTQSAAPKVTPQRGLFDWLGRLAPARLTSRIILINFVGLVILVVH